jgi:uncharacterized Tic20 family protein
VSGANIMPAPDHYSNKIGQSKGSVRMDNALLSAVIQGGAVALLTFVLWRVDQTAAKWIDQQGKEKTELIALVKQCMDERDHLK